MMKVEVVESTLVAPSEETPRRALWLSNLDLAVPKTHTPLVYYYPAPAPTPDGENLDFFSPERLKGALARALVLFYPLAGRLRREGEGGRLQIDCNGEGALFVVARAPDVAGEDLFGSGYEPSPEIRRMFVPFVPSGDPPCLMAMFQVTFLKCGGVVLGTGIHHVTMDGMGAFHFIQTWTGLARGLALSDACPSLPFHDRTLLRARSPPHPEFDHPVYSPAYLNGAPRPFVTRVYSISPKLLTDLKSRCAPGVSTYGAVTAHLWRCMCVARGLAPGSDTRLRVPANIRHRLRPQLPRQFFGNAIVRDLVSVKVGDVLSQPLGYVADMIRKAVDHVDDAYTRSVIDYLEVESEKGSQAARGQLMPESDLWVVSWLGMPMYDADFGWGAPRFVAPAQMFGSGTAYVTQRGADRDDGIAVLFALEPEYLQCFQDVFYGE
ncbi:putrescine hydroxycinnamoyltransferase 1-like [Triticum dicoccoides]|uniref:putrescine hydroxycinnamoyltransferase 1-like n=1 Tax=Triticum dicoccoides TaxID=85692 RepID=UPI000E7C61A6|nr:putrescine hydroxycinnamoyltransferase 1-like [Triticum dicoccoides]